MVESRKLVIRLNFEGDTDKADEAAKALENVGTAGTVADAITRNLSVAFDEAETSASELSDTVEDSGEKIAVALDKGKESAEGVNESVKDLGDSAEETGEKVGDLGDSTGDTGEQADESQGSFIRFTAALAAFVLRIITLVKIYGIFREELTANEKSLRGVGRALRKTIESASGAIGDINDLVSGFRRATGFALKFFRALTTGLGPLGLFVAGVIAAVAALATVVSRANAIIELQTFADTTGFAVTELDRMRFALGKLGVESDVTFDGIKTLTVALGELESLGTGPAQEGLQALGVSYSDIRTLSPEDQFLEISDAIAGATDKQVALAAAAKLFGEEAAARMVPALQAGSAELRRLADDGEAAGAVISEDLSNRAREFQAAMSRVGENMDSFINSLTSLLLPVVTGIIDLFADLGDIIGILFPPSVLKAIAFIGRIFKLFFDTISALVKIFVFLANVVLLPFIAIINIIVDVILAIENAVVKAGKALQDAFAPAIALFNNLSEQFSIVSGLFTEFRRTLLGLDDEVAKREEERLKRTREIGNAENDLVTRALKFIEDRVKLEADQLRLQREGLLEQIQILEIERAVTTSKREQLELEGDIFNLKQEANLLDIDNGTFQERERQNEEAAFQRTLDLLRSQNKTAKETDDQRERAIAFASRRAFAEGRSDSPRARAFASGAGPATILPQSNRLAQQELSGASGASLRSQVPPAVRPQFDGGSQTRGGGATMSNTININASGADARQVAEEVERRINQMSREIDDANPLPPNP